METLKQRQRQRLGQDKPAVNGNWLSLRGSIKSEWNRLSEHDLDFIDGRLTELEGCLQNRYGWGRQETRDAVNSFLRRVRV